MGKERDIRCCARPDIICLEGNGSRPSHRGDGWIAGEVMYTLNLTEVHAVCYGISPYASNAMKSSNPHSGIYVAETARTLDLNGGNPACNQGGIAVVQPIVFESHGQDARYKLLGDICETVSAKYGTGGGNTPIVLKYEETIQSSDEK